MWRMRHVPFIAIIPRNVLKIFVYKTLGIWVNKELLCQAIASYVITLYPIIVNDKVFGWPFLWENIAEDVISMYLCFFVRDVVRVYFNIFFIHWWSAECIEIEPAIKPTCFVRGRAAWWAKTWKMCLVLIRCGRPADWVLQSKLRRLHLSSSRLQKAHWNFTLQRKDMQILKYCNGVAVCGTKDFCFLCDLLSFTMTYSF